MAENRLLDLAYGSRAEPSERYREPSTYLARGLLPTLPLAAFEADSVRMPEAPDNPSTAAMRSLAERIPHNGQDPRLSGSMGLSDMLRGALHSSANWLDWRPGIPDMLTPTGAMAFGSAPAGAFAANALRRSSDLPALWRDAHPRTSVEGRTLGEGIANSAVKANDEMFMGPTHYDAMAAAEAKFGPGIWEEAAKKQTTNGGLDDGFITSTGRYLDRYEAMALARAVNDPAKRSFRDFMDSTDLPHVGPWSKGVIRADSSRASLPGTIVNGLEQSGKPTAGTTPLSPRASAVEQGQRGMYEVQGQPFQRNPDAPISGMRLEDATRHMQYYQFMQREAAAGNRDARRQVAYMDRNHMPAAAQQIIDQHHAGPRSETYWRGLDEFNNAELPARALSQDEKGRFYDKNRLNADAASLPGTVLSPPRAPQEQPDLADFINGTQRPPPENK